jgi:hypothetical protein
MINNLSGTRERRRYPRTNEMLAARVCVAIEETIAHARHIQVFADAGEVTLRGVAKPEEMIDLLNAASSVGGVTLLNSCLETS